MELLIFASMYPAYRLASFFIDNEPGEKEQQKSINFAIGFGVASVVLAIIISYIFDLFIFNNTEINDLSFFSREFPSQALNIASYAAIEEVVKFIPFAIFIYKKPYFNEFTDGIIYFAIVGLSFGAIETLLYSLGGAGLITIIMRYGIGLFLHGSLTAIVGFSLIYIKLKHSSKALVPLVLLAVIALHTMYNIGVYASALYPQLILLSIGVSVFITGVMLYLYYRSCRLDFIDGRTSLVDTSQNDNKIMPGAAF
jgi:RsiW-degrading membrane proteinase PrsW (M82 family)